MAHLSGLHGASDKKIRSPEVIRSEGNHLAAERSLYLAQHAHNPIEWYPWGPQALRRATEEDKPIFLSIGYASCHWCHVMEHEVFEHNDVAAFLNEHFISIKVDREERPDLDAVYMEAVQLLTGGGGWPMTLFLTPSLKPFFGGTYIPHDAFLSLAQQVRDLFLSRRQEIDLQAHSLASAIAAAPTRSRDASVERALIDDIARQGMDLYDERAGGFRSRMKFPTPLRWAFLLHHYRKTGDATAALRIRHTLDAMQSAGLRDHVGGGFHRYAVDPNWLIPHFEKMLYDNAQMASLYLEAGQVFASESYAQVARDTLEFLIRDMGEERGGFSASYDADSDGREGEFYAWTPDEIEQAVGPSDGPALALLLGVTRQGNFEGSNVLTRTIDPEAVARRFNRSPPEVATLFDRCRPALLEARGRRTPPARDRKVVTSWNGLALAALAQAHAIFGSGPWLDAATKTADFLWESHLGSDGTLRRASNGGIAAGDGILDDYAFYAWGLIELHQATGETRYLERARRLVDQAIEGFSHPDGGFYLTSRNAETPLGRKMLTHDSVEPSGQSVMVQCLVRLAALTDEVPYLARAEEALRSHVGVMREMGMEMAWWADAALRWIGPFFKVVVTGNAPDLVRSVRQLAAPHVVLHRAPDDGTTPWAQACRFGTCHLPTTNVEELRRQVLEEWKV